MQKELFNKTLPHQLSDVVNIREMLRNMDSVTVTRGKSYHREGAVSHAEVAPGFQSIQGRVRGSRPQPYEQNITLTFEQEGTLIQGACTCPIQNNCKHVAAVLFQALENQTRNIPGPIAVAQPKTAVVAPLPVEPVLPYEITTWLDQLALSAIGDEYPADVPQRLLYVFTSETPPNSSAQLAVDAITVRKLKGGEYSSSVNRPSLNSFYLGSWPRYFRSSDIEISQALLASRNGYHTSAYPVRAENLWQRIVQTGRAFWKDHQSVPLQTGEARAGRIEWSMADGRGMRPVLLVDDAIALNAEPPVYVDLARKVMGPVSLPLAAPLAYRLLNAPAISPNHLGKVGETLGRHLPAGSELVPKALEPPVVINEAPRPVLRLKLANEKSDGYYRTSATDMPVARLSFRYGPVEAEFGDTRMAVETLSGNRRYQARRNSAREKQETAKLFDLGLRLAREIYSLLGPQQHQYFAFPDPYSWLEFLSHDASVLEAQGFEILVDNDFPYRLAKPSGEIDTEIFEGTGIDWFELGMGISVDGQKIDLAPMLANLVLSDGLNPDAVTVMANDGDDVYIPLDDGRHLALAAKRLLPVVIALHELTMGGATVDKNGRLRMSKAETALLAGLEHQEGVAFRGGENLRSMARALASSLSGRIAPVEISGEFKATLRPYQAQGVAWLNLLREVGLGGILADDMGLGKTVQILALLAIEKAAGRLNKPALIVAPTSLMTNWQNEAKKFAPGLRLLLLHGAARKERFEEITKNDIVLTTYPLIARDQAVLLEQPWHMAILDEAQTIKNPNAATTKLIRDLRAEHRFCMTGTPMENHLGELWSLMSFVNPGYLGDKTGFGRRWRTPIEKYADSERSAALSRRVRPFMLRRTKQEVAGELPPKTEITEAIELEEQQRIVYDSIRLSMHKKVRQAIAAKGLAKSHIIILEALLKLRQVCCDPRLLKLATGTPPPSAKLERLMRMLEELLAEGRKIIVFSQFTSMLDLMVERLQAAGITFSLLTGQTVDRKTAIDSFQMGDASVFLVSLKAGGVGLNLTAADTVILYDPWWNPAVEEQAIDRAYRIGQDKPVFVYRLVASQTIEEKMDELKAKKRALAGSIFDQAGNPATTLTEQDLDHLFDV